MTTQTDTLAEIAALLSGRLPEIPTITASTDWPEYDRSRRAHLDAAAALGDRLAEKYGAKISYTPATGHRIRMAGITSTCTSGLAGAFANWLANATRKIDAHKQAPK